MPTIHKTALVPYSPAQMYALVNAIADYPQFLPHCSASNVLSENEDEIKASLTLEWSGIQKSFTTCNRLQKNKMIEVRLEEGPFKHLEGFWRFEPLEGNDADNGCKIIFDLEFEIAGMILSAMFGPVFQQIMLKLMDAFVERAKVIYGEITH